MSKQRVIAYVDGFNLYHGIRATRRPQDRWLNPVALSLLLLKPGQTLEVVKYFSARISSTESDDDPGQAARRRAKAERQATYLKALRSLPEVRQYLGRYQSKRMRCRTCQSEWTTHEEKMTDVRMATELVADAFGDRFDVAMLISADSDLVPPIEVIRREFPDKLVIVAFPPRRRSKHLARCANGHTYVGRNLIANSLFPPIVQLPDGSTAQCPQRWSSGAKS